MHYLKKFLKGQTLHGFGVQVVDAKKELNYPDDINDKVYSAKLRAFIRKNNLNYAPIFLCSTNLYYSNLVNDSISINLLKKRRAVSIIKVNYLPNQSQLSAQSYSI